jgi:putative SOS response-associated peptidase YedK
MCFYFSNSKRALDLANRYGRKKDIIALSFEVLEEQYRISGFTHPACPIITTSEYIGAARWGLIPALTRSESEAKKSSKMCLNARSETVFNLPSFYNPVLTKRCLIPATGYFEFHHRDGSAIPHYIFLKDEEIFSFGGLFEVWKRKTAENETIKTFTILTVPANSLCAGIHNGGKNPGRMPLIINREKEAQWLNLSLKKSEIQEFFQPFAADRMDAYPVAKDFLKMRSYDESIIKPTG